MVEATGFVTAGGRSSRMGRDKAWLEVGGQAMIKRVIAALTPVTTAVRIIANHGAYERLGLPVIADTYSGVGPLEAIRTSLAVSSTKWSILVACDLPFVTSDLFTYLLTIADQLDETLPPVAAIVPLNEDGLIEPLCALYSQSALAAVTDLIAAGERKVSRMFDRLPVHFVSFQKFSALHQASLFFANINTPEEYQAAARNAYREGTQKP